MHYAISHRDSKFWNWVKDDWKPSTQFEWYKGKLLDPTTPIPSAGKFSHVFVGSNWTTWMVQLGYPVAKRDTTISDSNSEKMLSMLYNKYEKHRHVWSRDHSVEIDRRNGL
jgi:hypothetical protein